MGQKPWHRYMMRVALGNISIEMRRLALGK
jgi:hypothetical protein